MRRKRQQRDPFYLVTRSHYERLIDNVIDGASPATHMACDWLCDPLALGIFIFPLAIYAKMREHNHGNSGS